MLDEETKKKLLALAHKLAEDSGQGVPGGESGAEAAGKPRVRLPGDWRPMSEFAREIGAAVARDGVFLRESQPVVVDPVTRRLVDLDADCFRTYVEKSLVTFRLRPPKEEGEAPQEVPVTMGKEAAKAVLSSHEFLAQQRPVRTVSEVPLPVLRADGALELLGPGYDAGSRVLVLGEEKK
jgi:hypothetical protein